MLCVQVRNGTLPATRSINGHTQDQQSKHENKGWTYSLSHLNTFPTHIISLSRVGTSKEAHCQAEHVLGIQSNHTANQTLQVDHPWDSSSVFTPAGTVTP